MERIKRISELLDSWNNLFVQNQSAGIVSGDSSIARGYRWYLDSQLTFNPLDRKQYLDRLSKVYLARCYCRVLFSIYLVWKTRRTQSHWMCFSWMGECSKQHFGVPNVRWILLIERSCKSRIIIQIDKSLSKAAVDNCVQQHHSDLLLRHQELCPWYNIHGSENLTNPLLLPRSQLLTDFESRLASFETSSVLLFMNPWSDG